MTRRAAVLAVVLIVGLAAACGTGGGRGNAIDDLASSGAYTREQATCFVDEIAAGVGLEVLDPGHELTADDVRALAGARRRCAPFAASPAAPVTTTSELAEEELAEVVDDLRADYVATMVRGGELSAGQAECVADALLGVLGPEALGPDRRGVRGFAAVEADAVVACRRAVE